MTTEMFTILLVIGIFGSLGFVIGNMAYKEKIMNLRYRDKKGIIVKWDSWKFFSSYEYERRPALIVECQRDNELFNVWYEVSFEEFKSAPIGAEIEIKEDWAILEVQRVKEDGVETILDIG